MIKIKKTNKDNENTESSTTESLNNMPNAENVESNNDNNENTYIDLFYLRNGYFTENDVLEIDMPKFILKNSVKNMLEINEKSNLNIVFLADNTNSDISRRLMVAAKEGFKKFEIVFPSADKKSESVWKFEDIKILGIDFGNVQHKRQDPRVIHCELEYKYFSIDEEMIF